MRRILLLMTTAAAFLATACGSETQLKPRIVVLTDIGPGRVEPDDNESLVRLLAHADMLEIEAIIATGGWNTSDGEYPLEWMDYIDTCLTAYGKDVANLMKRSQQEGFMADESAAQPIGYWPSEAYLRSRVKVGSRRLGMAEIGPENRSEGSDLIISLVDENDPRPLCITVWGGANTLSQAIWDVQQTRSEAELKAFLSQLMVYTITDQDVPIRKMHEGMTRHPDYEFSSHYWLRDEFADDLTFIWDESAWYAQNDNGKADWDSYAQYIQPRGNLGAAYPKYLWGVEGDTPSYLYFMPSGISDYRDPTQASWAGVYARQTSRDGHTVCWTNWRRAENPRPYSLSMENATRFYRVQFNNFAARMDWAAYGHGNRNPQISIDGDASYDVLYRKAKAGKTLNVEAAISDPDGDDTTVSWWFMEHDGYVPQSEILSPNSAQTGIRLAKEDAGHRLHLICEVSDSGTPTLTSFRRIVIAL